MKILIVGDRWVSRAGIKQLLTRLEKKAQIFEAITSDEAVNAAIEQDFDLIVLDLGLNGDGAFTCLDKLQDNRPWVPIAVLSAKDRRQDVLHAIDLGAMGYIPKTASGDEILDAIKMVLAGNVYMPRSVLEKPSPLSEEKRAPVRNLAPSEEQMSNLTKRQQEVFELLAGGLSNREIAKIMNVSEHTVRIHVSAMLKALHVANRTQAAVAAATWLAEDHT